MRRWKLKTKIELTLSVALMVFLSYIFFRVRNATGVPVVHSLWSFEIASLLRITAKSVQLLGLVVLTSTLINAVKKWKGKEPFLHVPVLQTFAICAVSFAAPDLAYFGIPILFGSTGLYF